MGAIYYESFLNVQNPRIGLVNIGEEETKGNDLTKKAYKLLKEDESIHFVGNIEAREITSGDVDVVVCDGFVGNVILKLAEGLSQTLFKLIKRSLMKSLVSKVGAIMIKKSLKGMMKSLDYTEYGGAPLLGLNGLVVKSHGSSDAKAIKNTVLQCSKFHSENVNEKIKEKIQ